MFASFQSLFKDYNLSDVMLKGQDMIPRKKCVSIPLQGLQAFGLAFVGSRGGSVMLGFNPSSRITTFRTDTLVATQALYTGFNPSSRITTFRTSRVVKVDTSLF